jgi:hypothetical protein
MIQAINSAMCIGIYHIARVRVSLTCVSSDFKTEVACRQLGYTAALGFEPNSNFGRVSKNFAFSGVKCRGNEPSLANCPHDQRPTCDQSHAVGKSFKKKTLMRVIKY